MPGISHDHVVRVTEQTAAGMGLPLHPAGKVFWYNTDYQLYHFIGLFREFSYIVTVEYDCVVNVPIEQIVLTMADNGADFCGCRVRGDAASWYWASFVKPYYPADLIITGRLLCFAVFSHGFAQELKAARQGHATRFLAQAGPSPLPWPNNEGFVGAELARSCKREISLAEFGDIFSYDWAPPLVEAQLPQLARRAFVHPLLDEPRFLNALIRSGWDVEEIFNPQTVPAKAAMACAAPPLIQGLLRHFTATDNIPAIERLRVYAALRQMDAATLFKEALGKPAA